MNVKVALEDNLGNPVGGASVSVRVDNLSGPSATGTATTASDGTVTFTWKNSPPGCFITTATNVVAAGWDPNDPVNVSQTFCK